MERGRNILRFGTFALDADTRQVLQRGREVRLSPKAFELLQVLVLERPKALSKADLQTRLWPDTFVTEGNLASLVKEIRQALGDDSKQPQFIRTLHGFGYAFAAPASEGSPPAEVTFWLVGDPPVRLSEGVNVLGRDPDATVWFGRPGVSRRHAQIVIARDEATIEDLGSTNGTWLGTERVTGPTPLHDGDCIMLGPFAVTFRARRAEVSTEVVNP